MPNYTLPEAMAIGQQLRDLMKTARLLSTGDYLTLKQKLAYQKLAGSLDDASRAAFDITEI